MFFQVLKKKIFSQEKTISTKGKSVRKVYLKHLSWNQKSKYWPLYHEGISYPLFALKLTFGKEAYPEVFAEGQMSFLIKIL